MNRTITQLVILARTFADELEAILQNARSIEEQEHVDTLEDLKKAPAKKRGRPAAAAAAAATATAPAEQQATAEPAKEEKAEAVEGMPLEELKALIDPAVKAGIGSQVRALIVKHGGTQLSTIPAANHAAFAAEVGELVY